MPPIFLHMAMARDAQARLAVPALDGHEGEYFLGATTPDIRAITRWDRERTHFFSLNTYDHQDSVRALFEAHPELAKPEHLSTQTVAFMAGYITHLCLDERYICDVYRPYFGQRSALGGDLTANTMDRLLQFELDRQRREQPQTASEIRDALEDCSLALNVGFLDSEILTRWHQVAIEQTKHPPDWRRFKYQGGRHLPGVDLESEAAMDAFIEQVPALLEQTMRHVSTARVDAYVEEATEAAALELRRYLGTS